MVTKKLWEGRISSSRRGEWGETAEVNQMEGRGGSTGSAARGSWGAARSREAGPVCVGSGVGRPGGRRGDGGRRGLRGCRGGAALRPEAGERDRRQVGDPSALEALGRLCGRKGFRRDRGAAGSGGARKRKPRRGEERCRAEPRAGGPLGAGCPQGEVTRVCPRAEEENSARRAQCRGEGGAGGRSEARGGGVAGRRQT